MFLKRFVLFVLLAHFAFCELGLDVKKDFGAKGDGVTDDTAALQKGIGTAQAQRRTLLFPSGTYLINTTLTIPQKGPLRLQGESFRTTRILAGVPMFAVLNISWNGIRHEGTNIDMSNLCINAAGKATYGVNAPGLTRSYFTQVAVDGALETGFLHGGWIDVFEMCVFGGNREQALFLSSENNNVIVRGSSFEGNPGHAIVVQGGAQVSLEDNVIEGNGGTGILASAVRSLVIQGNYFEENCIKGPLNYTKATNSSFWADIVIDGSGNGQTEIGGAYPTQGAQITGNYFNPHGPRLEGPWATAIALAGVVGATVSNNDIGGSTNVSIVLTNPNPLWVARDVTIHGNTGGCRPNCVFLEDPFQQYKESSVCSWSIQNIGDTLQGMTTFPLDSPLMWKELLHTGAPVNVTNASPSFTYNGWPVTRFTAPSTSDVIGVIANISNLPQAVRALQNVPVYFAARVLVQSVDTVVAFNMQLGTKAPWQSSADWYYKTNEWYTVCFQGVFLGDGALKFGVRLEGKGGPLQFLMAQSAASVVGVPYDTLFRA